MKLENGILHRDRVCLLLFLFIFNVNFDIMYVLKSVFSFVKCIGMGYLDDSVKS